MMQSPYRDSPANSVADLQDYYDVIPPAHHLTGSYGPTGTHSPFASTQDIPLTNTSHNNMQVGDMPPGAYAPPRGPYNSATAEYVYPAATRNNQWTEKPPRSKRPMWILISVIVAVIAVIAIGVSVGIVVSKKNNKITKNGPSSGSSSSGDGSSSGPSSVNQTDPNDPSTFQKDSRLKQSFYGFAYTPEGSLLPNCGNSLSQVITDIQLLSQLTTRIRLYGADCNQSALVLEAIKQTKVNMSVFLGNYPVPDDNNAAYNRQKADLKSAIETYGADHIAGITVGNEFMLNYLTAHNEQDPNSATGNTGADLLIADITDTRDMLASMSLTGKILVGNSDAGAYFNTKVLEAIDYGLSNVHPWFGHVDINDAAGWTWDFFNTNNVQVAAALPNAPAMYIAETGWPTNSSDVAHQSDGPSLATEPNLQIFLDTFVCTANTNNTRYFFFEYFDEVWKDIQFGGVEGHWGLFYANRTLKDVTIPDCVSP